MKKQCSPIPLCPEKLKEMVPPLRGDPHGCCSVKEFLTQMPKVSAGRHSLEVYSHDGLRVFWYPPDTTKTNNHYSVINNPPSIQERIKSFLLSLSNFAGDVVLVQFWAPIRRSSTGQRMLSVVGQPFEFGKLYNGLCRYRYRCMEYEYPVVEVGDNTSRPVGPIGRVFARGYIEYIPLQSYTEEWFPLKNYAVNCCGIYDYLVMPLSERDDHGQHHCIGVLELVALKGKPKSKDFSPDQFNKELEVANFVLGAGKSSNAPQCCNENAFWRTLGDENEATSRPNAQDKAKCSRRRVKFTKMKYQIPYEESMQQLGKKRKEAVRELGVSKSTRKDIYGHFDTGNWRQKRKARQIQPNRVLPSEYEEEESGETVPEPEIRPFPNNNANDEDGGASNPTPTIAKGKSVAIESGNKIDDDGSYTMNMVATYQGDNIKIEFSSRSGIEELRKEVDECFELEGKKFKIKYEEHGLWIMIPRDKDLHKYMDSLKTKGEDTMNLSIFPAT